MEAMRQSWTDDRLDDMSRHIDRRCEQVDRRFDRLEGEMRAGFDRVDRGLEALRVEMNEHRRQHTAEFNALNRTLFQLGGGIVAALVGVLITQL
jgi:hypothetical protein